MLRPVVHILLLLAAYGNVFSLFMKGTPCSCRGRGVPRALSRVPTDWTGHGIPLPRLPGFSDFLLVGFMKIGTVSSDFQDSRPLVTGFSALYKLSKVRPNNFSSFNFFFVLLTFFFIFLKFFLVFCPCAPSLSAVLSKIHVVGTCHMYPLPMCPIAHVPNHPCPTSRSRYQIVKKMSSCQKSKSHTHRLWRRFTKK